MRILFIANASSSHTVKWVNALAKEDYEVHLVYNANDQPHENEISPKVILHQLKVSGNIGYFLNCFELKKLSKRIKPDIANAHYASGYGTLARLSKVKPLVLSVWGSDVYDFPYQSKQKMELVKRNLLYADKIASTSHAMAKQVKRILDNENINVSVTPFGVDLGVFKKKNREYCRKEIVIGNVKSLKLVYGIEYLILSMDELLKRLRKNEQYDIANNIKLKIYGDGDQKKTLEDLIKRLGLQQSVQMMGEISQHLVPSALDDIDVFCVTSIQESFGVSLIEAMAHEIPIVSSDAEGFKEVNIDKITGFVVPCKDYNATADALEKLIDDLELRKKMGENGRKRVIENYDWNKNVQLMINIYKEVIDNNK